MDTSKFRKDAWRQVKSDDEDSQPAISILQLSDYKTISFRIAMNNAEKQRKARVQLNISQKQQDIDAELETRLRQIRIDSAEDAQKRTQAKRQQCERALLDAIDQMDESARQSEEASLREMAEMIEHNRAIIDRANKMKRDEEIRGLYESLMATKVLFIALFEAHAKLVISNQLVLQQMGRLQDFGEQQDSFLKRYEQILNVVNAKNISAVEVEAFEGLCADIKAETAKIDAEIVAYMESSSEAAAAAETTARAQADAAARAQTEARAAASAPSAVRITGDAVDANQGRRHDFSEFIDPARLEVYGELKRFYDSYKTSVKTLEDDDSMKTYRFNCKKAVNIPVNAISAVNTQHLQVGFHFCDLSPIIQIFVNSNLLLFNAFSDFVIIPGQIWQADSTFIW